MNDIYKFLGYLSWVTLTNPVVGFVTFRFVWIRLAVEVGVNTHALPWHLYPAWILSAIAIASVVIGVEYFFVRAGTGLSFTQFVDVDRSSQLAFLPFAAITLAFLFIPLEGNVFGFVIAIPFAGLCLVMIPLYLFIAVRAFRQARDATTG